MDFSHWGWDFKIFRDFNDREAHEYAALPGMLEGIPLDEIKDDRRVWNLQMSGIFSIKSIFIT